MKYLIVKSFNSIRLGIEPFTKYQNICPGEILLATLFGQSQLPLHTEKGLMWPYDTFKKPVKALL